jgi:hypothetical protein
MEEVVKHSICSEIQVLKSGDIFFHYTRLSWLGQVAQMMGVSVKSFIEVNHKLGPSNIPSTRIFTPFPPFPVFRIQIKDTDMKFGQIVCNAMQGEIMFHLSNPAGGVQAIKFSHIDFGKMKIKMKGVGMKGHVMGGVISF